MNIHIVSDFRVHERRTKYRNLLLERRFQNTAFLRVVRSQQLPDSIVKGARADRTIPLELPQDLVQNLFNVAEVLFGLQCVRNTI